MTKKLSFTESDLSQYSLYYRAARTAKKSFIGPGTVLAKTLCQKEFPGPRPLILPAVLCCVTVFGVVLEQEGVFGGWVAVWCQHANE